MKLLKRFWFDLLASPARLRLYLWLSLVTQILLVVTGGLVRLTASGLGCPTWPKCTDESLVSTSEMGIHGIIEFGNRLLTFVLLIIAVLMFAVAMRLHSKLKKLLPFSFLFFGGVLFLVLTLIGQTNLGFSWLIATGYAIGVAAAATGGVFLVRIAKSDQRRGILVPAFGLGLGIIAQAAIGGITVLTGLNPWIVGLHFVVSGILIATASTMVFRGLPKPEWIISKPAATLSWPSIIAGATAVVFGVIVTGAGPHAGDINTPRNGLDIEIWQHYHSYPGYLMLGLIGAQLLMQLRAAASFKNLASRTLILLFSASVIQAGIGVIQSRLGVPPLLVGAHMLGAAVIISLLTFQLLTLRRKVA